MKKLRGKYHRSVFVSVFVFVILMFGIPLKKANSASGNLNITLKVRNTLDIARVEEPVTSGIPIPENYNIFSVDALNIMDSYGQYVPSQFVVTARWGGSPGDISKPVKWVLATFLANVSSGETAKYYLTSGVEHESESALEVITNTDAQMVINSGAATFVIDKRNFSIFDDVSINGKSIIETDSDGFKLTDTQGHVYTSSNDAPTVVVEERGPVRIVVRVEGSLRDNSRNALLDYKTYLYFYSGKSYARVLFSVANHNEVMPNINGPGGSADVFDFYGQNSITFEELSAGLKLHESSGALSYLFPGCGVEATSGYVSSNINIYQDSSGTDYWNRYTNVDHPRPNSYCRFKGYKVFVDGSEIDSGNHFSGWLDISNSSKGICAGMVRFWQNFPKALTVSETAVQAKIFPSDYDGAYNFRVGEQKTTELFFYFHGNDVDNRQVAATASALTTPMMALAPVDWYVLSGGIQETIKTVDSVKLYSRVYNELNGNPQELSLKEIYDYYNDRTIYEDPQYNGPYSNGGVFHSLWESSGRYPSAKDYFNYYGSLAVGYGNLPLDYEPYDTGKAGPFDSKYNMEYGAWLQFLRKGDNRWKEMAKALSHYAEQLMLNDVKMQGYRWKNAVFGHAEHGEPGNDNGQRNYYGPVLDTCFGAPGELLHYYLTGYPISKSFVEKLADYTYDFYLESGTPRYEMYNDNDYFGVNGGNPSVTTEPREFAHVLHNLTAGFLLTGNSKYKNLAQNMVEFFGPENEAWINGPVSGVNASFQSWALNMYLHAMGGYIDALSEFGLKVDEQKAKEAMLGYVDWITNYGSVEKNGYLCTYYMWSLSGVQEGGNNELVNNWMYEVADIYAYAYKYTGNQQYLTLAGKFFETASHNQAGEGDVLTYCTAKEAVNAARFGHIYLYYAEAGGGNDPGNNHPPVADAGPNQTVNAREMVALDAGGSNDADGDTLFYQWQQISSDEIKVDLQNVSSVQAQFTAPPVGAREQLDFHFMVKVSDGINDPVEDTVTVTVKGKELPEGQYVVTLQQGVVPEGGVTPYEGTLDAYIISGKDGNFGGSTELTVYNSGTPGYRFMVKFDLSEISLPAGAVIKEATLVLKRLEQRYGSCKNALYPMEHDWVEGTGTWGDTTDGATWTTYDGSHPWGNAGGDYDTAALIGMTEEFQVGDPPGYVSFDVTELAKAWVSSHEDNFGVMMTVAGGYDNAATYYASREYGVVLSRPALEIIYAVSEGEETNNPPVANAGPDQSVASGAEVTLDGSGSNDPDGDSLNCQWIQAASDDLQVTINNDTSPVAEFTAPSVAAGEQVALHFTLTVSDEINNPVTDTVTIITRGEESTDTEHKIIFQQGVVPKGGTEPYMGTMDAYIVAGTQGGNFGGGDVLTAYNSSYRVMVRFDLGSFSLPEDAVIKEATLRLKRQNQQYGSSKRILYSMTHDWVEGTGTWGDTTDGATWTTYDGSHLWDSPGGDYEYTEFIDETAETQAGSPSDYECFDVTNLVKDWVGNRKINYGFMITIASGCDSAVYYASRENSDIASRPALEIIYAASEGEETNNPPVANAGPDQSVASGAEVTLDGNGSNDPDGDSLSCQWIQAASDDLQVTINNDTSPVAEFTAPSVAAGEQVALHFTLTVSDGINNPMTDTVTVTVINEEDGGNLLENPDADEGLDNWNGSHANADIGEENGDHYFIIKTAQKKLYQDVSLTGIPGIETGKLNVEISASERAQNAGAEDGFPVLQGYIMGTSNGPNYINTYMTTEPVRSAEWTQVRAVYPLPATSGKVRIFMGSSSTQNAVVHTSSYFDKLAVRIQLADGTWYTLPDDGVNHPPVADAGADQTVNAGALVTLDGSGSSDPDGDVLTYQWSQSSSDEQQVIAFENVNDEKPTFLAPAVELGGQLTLHFLLTVSDGISNPAMDVVVVTVNGENVPGAGLSQPTDLNVRYRNGQSFVTWNELDDVEGEQYRIYRYREPITAENVLKAQMIYQVAEGSGIFYNCKLLERYVIEDGGNQISEGTGLLVWTLAKEDFTNGESGQAYYAVVSVDENGKANLDDFTNANTFGPVDESVAAPLCVEVGHDAIPDRTISDYAHYYIQYMDLRNWNPTFHAPRQDNGYWGYNPDSPAVKNAIAYAYDYSITEPLPENCPDGVVPDQLGTFILLHGWTPEPTNIGDSLSSGTPWYCALQIFIEDLQNTWYFGFAKNHDFRMKPAVEAGENDTVVNYTEQRILRMFYDLTRHPSLRDKVDPQRFYYVGGSMGGTGGLALALRYPDVFASGYNEEGITNWRTDGDAGTAVDWRTDISPAVGTPEQNLPVEIGGVNGWADQLKKFNGTGVWDWQNHQAMFANLENREVVPFGILHGYLDDKIEWETQGKPVYEIIDDARVCWSGKTGPYGHSWSNFGGCGALLMSNVYQPFFNFTFRKDEAVPGFSGNSVNSEFPPSEEDYSTYNINIMWSSSWNNIDGPPVDTEGLFSISLYAVAYSPYGTVPGNGETFTADITPRRLQHFKLVAGKEYNWENINIEDGNIVASGQIHADEYGLVTIPDFQVTSGGNRLVLIPVD